MEIQINGRSTGLPDANISLVDLILFLELAHERVAIELNETVVQKRDWATTHLKSNDRVEIVHFVGGG